jgi:hypothetical protein
MKSKICRDSSQSKLLNVTGGPGCRKSVLLKFLVGDELKSSNRRLTCYFFFCGQVEQEDSVIEAICAILHHIFVQAPYLINCALGRFNIVRGNLLEKSSCLCAVADLI